MLERYPKTVPKLSTHLLAQASSEVILTIGDEREGMGRSSKSSRVEREPEVARLYRLESKGKTNFGGVDLRERRDE